MTGARTRAGVELRKGDLTGKDGRSDIGVSSSCS